MEVDCKLLWSTAVAVCLGDVSGLSPCFLPSVFFPIFYYNLFLRFRSRYQLGPAVFGFVRLMARFRPPPASV